MDLSKQNLRCPLDPEIPPGKENCGECDDRRSCTTGKTILAKTDVHAPNAQLRGDSVFQVEKDALGFVKGPSVEEIRKLLRLSPQPTNQDHIVLSEKLGITLQPRHVPLLINEVTEYFVNKELFNTSQANISEIRKGLQDFLRWAADSVEYLEQTKIKCGYRVNYDRLDQIEKLIWEEYASVHNKRKKIRIDKGGPRPNSALRAFLSRLILFYEDATGKKCRISQKSPAFQFIDKLLKLINDPPWSPQSLEQALKRVRKNPSKTFFKNDPLAKANIPTSK